MGRKGLPAKYIRAAWKTRGATKKNALKRAWAAFRRAKGSSKSRSTKTKTKSTKRRKSNPNRRVNRTAKGKSLVQTAYSLIPQIALAAPTINVAMSKATGTQKIGMWVRAYTGYSMSSAGLGTRGFNLGHAAEGWAPFLASKGIVLAAQKISGLIRRIR